jgi:hypothetical protein
MLMAQVAYQLDKTALANKLINSVDGYLTDQLDYNYTQVQSNGANISMRDIQYGVQFIHGMAIITGDNHQTALSTKLNAQLKDYESKFASLLQRQQ